MASLPAVTAVCLASLLLLSAVPLNSSYIPEWLLGDWVPVNIYQDEDTLYPSKEDEPRNWLAGKHLLIDHASLTLADDRCEHPEIALKHGRPSTPIQEKGSGTIESLGLSLKDDPIDYFSFKCSRDIYKPRDEMVFVQARNRRTEITWYVIVLSHNEIDVPFFGGSYIKFRKTSPAT